MSKNHCHKWIMWHLYILCHKVLYWLFVIISETSPHGKMPRKMKSSRGDDMAQKNKCHKSILAYCSPLNFSALQFEPIYFSSSLNSSNTTHTSQYSANTAHTSQKLAHKLAHVATWDSDDSSSDGESTKKKAHASIAIQGKSSIFDTPSCFMAKAT